MSTPASHSQTQVLAVEPVKLVGDVQLAVGAALDPHPVRVSRAGRTSTNGVSPAAGVPVAVLQRRAPRRAACPVSASSAHSSRSRSDPDPLAPAAIPAGARVADRLDLRGRQRRRDRRPRRADLHHLRSRSGACARCAPATACTRRRRAGRRSYSRDAVSTPLKWW